MMTVKAEGQDAELHLSEEEVLAQVCGDYYSQGLKTDSPQMKVLLLAGYETTSGKLISFPRLSYWLTRCSQSVLR